ncbi:MAG: PAS domain-containing protein, partial [Chloroflexi bacterium]|nr:PAS domain-containing protein [Chloroflexota bacterium]
AGQHFTALFPPWQRESAQQFIDEIQSHKAALDRKMTFRLGERTAHLYLTGGAVNDVILIVGALSRAEVASQFYEELMTVNNEQLNALRIALKEQAMLTRKQEELTSLNNELVTLQRELAKKHAEVTKERERYRLVSEVISDYAYAFRVDHEGNLKREWVTQAFERITGYSTDSDTALDWTHLVHPDDRAIAEERAERLLSGKANISEFRIITKDDEVHWIRDYARPVLADSNQEQRVVRIYGAAQDITRQKEMAAELQRYTENLEQLVAEKVKALEQERSKVIQASKLAAIGEMATGVAHELNQPLTAISFEADYLQQIGEREGGHLQGAALWEELTHVGTNLTGDVDRCRRIIDHLRTFGRVTEKKTEPTNLNEPIRNSFLLIGERLKQHNVIVERHLAPELPPIMADPHRLEQVFLNLISNGEYATAAMQARIEAGEIERPDYEKRLEIRTKANEDFVIATVRDNGSGIPPEARDHIFEPFFTTKPVGEGTGLGLSISYGIVRDFDGDITFESQRNKGTTFYIRFPITDLDPQDR